MTTTSRLLSLLSLLQTRRDWPGPVLAERLGISHRTVRRDVNRLREMGYSIHAAMGPEGGYRLDAGSELPPLLFDDDQVVALAVALQTAATTGVGIDEAALRALTTVRQVMPSRLRHRLNALQFTTVQGRPSDAILAPVSPEVLVTVSTATRAREVLRFDYTDGRPETTSQPTSARRVEPHHLVTSHGRWYLVAWDLEHDDWRLFRADRITPRTPNGARFSPRELPGGDVAAYVSARFKGSAHANRWPCTGTVIIHLPAEQVLPFAGDGSVEHLGPDRCGFEAGSWSWVALAASLNRFDADVEVVGPPELTEAFATLASRNRATSSTTAEHRAPKPTTGPPNRTSRSVGSVT
ncbi:helix-turn-helix transcriptional regulator [Aeromicrobium endophyticum]|uniref:WYL domain-containing protein n=1 Tax=Aeromicrobium endophyticum TaxID=2292704 RepID=A0A371PCG6_9ACTN|nr:WYL domain-containing protein [Aeromicrobium endophyticum]REK73603.1 WYL domain-containing protein [Aeromicrobium endophyticum]